MSKSNSSRASFDDSDSRHDDMHSTIEAWIDDLTELVEEATESETFRQWLDVQSKFHEYSYRNSLLIALQCPEATKVAGYRTWQDEFQRQVSKGEDAIWIWAPIIAKQCPQCGNSASYCENSTCEYDETPPKDWSRGLVGFRPVPVFDVSQTEGEPLPDLDTTVSGDGEELVDELLESALHLDISVSVIPEVEWTHGVAKGVCTYPQSADERASVEVKARSNQADLAHTLVHEYAHALLHGATLSRQERSKREVEAESVAYLVGRELGLEVDNAAFYLAAWEQDDPAVIGERLDRISRTAQTILECLLGRTASA